MGHAVVILKGKHPKKSCLVGISTNTNVKLPILRLGFIWMSRLIANLQSFSYPTEFDTFRNE